MSVLRSIVCAFVCFSTIPMPRIRWDDDAMRYMMAAFPLVGVVVGISLWAWQLLCGHLGFGSLLRGAGFTLIPLAISGGIHMDGFADVIDAQASHADPERRRQILKDPHVGAFAIMGICGYLMAYLSLACELRSTDIVPLACIPVISRCLSSFATVSFRTSQATGMLASEQSTARAGATRITVAIMLLATVTVLLRATLLPGIALLAIALGSLAATRRMAQRSFGGMSGDLAGFFLQVAELAMLACLVVIGRLV